MVRTVLTGVVLALLAATPGVAQEKRPGLPMGAASVLVGLPVYTDDGRVIGKVIALARDRDEAVLIAEIERPMGIGPLTVAIPIDMFVQRPDRIELTLTAEQVKDRLAGPERER